MVSKETAYTKISQLVTRFSEQIKSYKNSDYNETLTRRDFIDPFFKALGWDMDNEEGNAEAYREVIHEDKIKIGSATKAPDYSFRLAGGKRLFFVEAKKPSVFVKEELPPAYQVRRYGWSAKLPISIVTDFEEFAIYDCTKKPKATDKASTARIKYLTYKEYLSEFDFIWDTFSKERVLKGSFDRFVLSDTGKKGTATVDKEFLESLNQWRKLLAETISINNVKLSEDELNFAVQQTLDRIIFLRICEDRGVEPYEKLKYCLIPPVKDGGVYKNLFTYFEEADKKYNSGLFDLAKDNVSRKLSIENKVLKKIIEELYYPDSPYEFSVLSVEILGSAYEQFLGKVIRLTPSHKAKIEEKPEVRKAGGVYYTPQYIVEYIVKNTVGKLIEGKTPKDVEKIKIVDPACGSGSFLIGAYQYLLDWHLSYYMGSSVTHPVSPKASHPSREGNKSNALTPDGRLTTAEKKKILINNIYGVDIDTQAVEVTKLSLLLKCMEGETLASVQQTMSFMHERILPTLENNIKSGNSLIDLNFYDGELEFSGTERKIKPFNWQAAFPEVFKQGGFDCVIGNPPYRKERDSKDLILELKKSTIGKKYYEGKMDLWYFFLHKAIDLSKNGGLIGIITNSYWIMSAGSTRLINRIKSELIMRQVIDFDDIKVFENVAGKHMIHLYIKKKSDKSDKVSYIKLDKKEFNGKIEDYKEISLNYENIFINASKISFTNCLKIETKNAFTIDDLYEVSQGVVEAPDKLSRKSLEKNRNNNYFVGQGVFVISKSELNSLHLNIKENKIIRKYLNSHNVERYGIKHENEYLIYSDKEAKEKISKGEYPNLRKHLDKFKSFITSSNGPYGIHRPRDNKYFEQTKLLCKGMFRKPEFCLDEQKHYVGFSFSVIIQKVEHYSLKYLLGLLNSKYAEYWFNANGKKRGIGVDIGVLVFRTFPIPKIDFANPAEKKKHDEIVKHVVAMLELNKELSRRDSFGAKSKPGEEQERLKQRITYTDKKIDALVYELYGLTEEEIKIVEDEG